MSQNVSDHFGTLCIKRLSPEIIDEKLQFREEIAVHSVFSVTESLEISWTEDISTGV